MSVRSMVIGAVDALEYEGSARQQYGLAFTMQVADAYGWVRRQERETHIDSAATRGCTLTSSAAPGTSKNPLVWLLASTNRTSQPPTPGLVIEGFTDVSHPPLPRALSASHQQDGMTGLPRVHGPPAGLKPTTARPTPHHFHQPGSLKPREATPSPAMLIPVAWYRHHGKLSRDCPVANAVANGYGKATSPHNQVVQRQVHVR
ncbi:hypothetical protein JDV02_007469 [Purpureocillium takamizusanense]|uniref:Uncharacterized protein n=1 Tax=Purpureocillium takamizusanense TaxID=2060973 RepID=A0A9Q8VE60_9HYPO|nr:uncharacterized protein JDV02_007469 [Purpureocillium takamizusanense]UNI21482.1 hypothetical protein JDV02_007469 [Purpureocillium takamizusanense]